MSLDQRHQKFADLHAAGTFVMPNPWDVGSARVMAAKGAVALATTSSGMAFVLGKPDMGFVTRDEALAHAQDIVAATNLPVSGDLENGFGASVEAVEETIRGAAEVGLSGCGIEDMDYAGGGCAAIPFDLAIERIRAACAAARGTGRPFVLTARADGVMNGVYDLAEGIRRLQAFQAAGAGCLFMPVPPGVDELRQVLAAVDGPVNALVVGPLRDVPLSEFQAMGVRRLSVGGAVARVAQGALVEVMDGIANGDFTGLNRAADGTKIDLLLEEGQGDV